MERKLTLVQRFVDARLRELAGSYHGMDTKESNFLWAKMVEGERFVAKRQLDAEMRHGRTARREGW